MTERVGSASRQAASGNNVSDWPVRTTFSAGDARKSCWVCISWGMPADACGHALHHCRMMY